MAKTLAERGLRIVSGRTDSHVFLVDLRAKGLTGKAAEAALGKAHITVNKNAIPNDPESPFVTSGIRIGSPAITTRGFKDEEARIVANLVADVLDNRPTKRYWRAWPRKPPSCATVSGVQQEVSHRPDGRHAACGRFFMRPTLPQRGPAGGCRTGSGGCRRRRCAAARAAQQCRLLITSGY
jgi:hypothetical protein